MIGGKSDPTTKKADIEQDGSIVKADIEQDGSIVFQAGNRKVPLRSVELKSKHTPLFAKVGGSQLKVASAGQVATKRQASPPPSAPRASS